MSVIRSTLPTITAATNWSTWLNIDLHKASAGNETVQHVVNRMQILRHLRPGNKVLDEVNDTMAGFHFNERAFMTHPDVTWQPGTGPAIDSLAGNITYMSDTGSWPIDWRGSPLKEMVLVLTAYTAALGQDYKAIVTIMTIAYVESHTPEDVLEQIDDLPLFAQATLSGVLLALHLTQDQQKRWLVSNPGFEGQTPGELAAALFAIARSSEPSAPSMA